MATDDRLQLAGWWPTKGTPARNEFVGSEVCGQCHASKFQSQKRTPMANASSLAANSLALRSHDRLTFHLASYTYEIVRSESGSTYSVSDGAHSIAAPLSWAFGLGESGQTYIFVRDGVFYESRLSYYRAPDALDFTPGAPTTPSADLEEALGRRMIYAPETHRCFGCHSTASTANNQFDPAHLIPGVTCEACHSPGAKHVAAMKAGHLDQGLAAIFNPGRLGPVDLVDFCGACHRAFMDVALTQRFGILNLRFQPYRLERSQCWEKARITCLDCHDPHEPRNRDLTAYDNTCLGCHSKAAGSAANTGHPGKVCTVSTKDCVSCHMPKYEMPGMHFKFTDHYIHIVRDGQGYVD
ncbi:MAG TPA: cytochrome c3 family protein [Terriglobales bacterium]|nr:cytochrome c3 family protein [Terriglobales bacterium]